MTPSPWDLPGFLIGHRASVERLIHGRGALFFSAALVMTAAFAREYDAVSWWHHPGDLLAPFAASILLASILFLWMWAALASSGMKLKTPWRHYTVFLTGYWLTAPLAWLYAVPIETMTDELSAIRFNLMALSIVSIWRVLLFSRVASIQFRVPMLAVLSWILVPCMAIAFIAVINAQLSIVSLMGGIRMTESEKLVFGFQNVVAGGIFYGFIPVVLFAIFQLIAVKRRELGMIACRRTRPMDGRLWAVPVIASVTLLYGAAIHQPKFLRAERVDAMLLDGDVNAAIELMTINGPHAFPIVWDPPPIAKNHDGVIPKIDQIATALNGNDAPAWVADRLLHEADELLLQQAGLWTRFQSPLTEDLTMEQLRTLEIQILLVDSVNFSDAEVRVDLSTLLSQVRSSMETLEERERRKSAKVD